MRDAQLDDEEENIDYQNYKGIYFGDDPNKKYQCPITGAHFEFNDMSKRLTKILMF